MFRGRIICLCYSYLWKIIEDLIWKKWITGIGTLETCRICKRIYFEIFKYPSLRDNACLIKWKGYYKITWNTFIKNRNGIGWSYKNSISFNEMWINKWKLFLIFFRVIREECVLNKTHINFTSNFYCENWKFFSRLCMEYPW